MDSGSNLSSGVRSRDGKASGGTELGRDVATAEHLPEGIRATVAAKHGEYDARRLRSQREVIRDVMLAAANCDTWLTLAELRALTHYGEASISAQLRHLRKPDLGAYDVAKRRRDECGAPSSSRHSPGSGRGDFLWEYRIAMPMVERRDAAREALAARSAG